MEGADERALEHHLVARELADLVAAVANTNSRTAARMPLEVALVRVRAPFAFRRSLPGRRSLHGSA